MFAGAFDSYSITARIAPSLLLIAPLIVVVPGLWPTLAGGAWLVGLSGVGLVLLFLVSQFVRDAGKTKEDYLVSEWGGLPTRLALRHLHGEDVRDVAELHARVESATGIKLPTLDEERADRASADKRYTSAIVVLRECTRDARNFPTVASANAVYGFRRNMLGARSAGLLTALLCLAASLGALLNRQGAFDSLSPVGMAVSLTSSAVLAVVWWRFVNEAWVRIAADDYANALLSACAKLALDRTATVSR